MRRPSTSATAVERRERTSRPRRRALRLVLACALLGAVAAAGQAPLAVPVERRPAAPGTVTVTVHAAAATNGAAAAANGAVSRPAGRQGRAGAPPMVPGAVNGRPAAAVPAAAAASAAGGRGTSRGAVAAAAAAGVADFGAEAEVNAALAGLASHAGMRRRAGGGFEMPAAAAGGEAARAAAAPADVAALLAAYDRLAAADQRLRQRFAAVGAR
ncbi:MAG TPA: hypothetical protein VJA16_00435, partial [Thermoanaerobaculia bacterium]